jgi:hypothetical protein
MAIGAGRAPVPPQVGSPAEPGPPNGEEEAPGARDARVAPIADGAVIDTSLVGVSGRAPAAGPGGQVPAGRKPAVAPLDKAYR